MARPDFNHEARLHAAGAMLVAGVDEAGRGPLAGPVVAAAVILPPENVPEGLDDSKKLTAPQRARLAAALERVATFAVAEASVAEIDRLNVLGASHLAMCRAVAALACRPDHCLIDGNAVPPELGARMGMAATAVVGGDGTCLSIAAASILAKVHRDRIMARLAASFPQYGWDRNNGYGTRAHMDALARHGPSPHHRRSFAPVRRLLEMRPPHEAD